MKTVPFQAIGLIGQTIQTQSSLLAYIDVFWLYTVFAGCMIALVLFMQPVDPRAAPAVH